MDFSRSLRHRSELDPNHDDDARSILGQGMLYWASDFARVSHAHTLTYRRTLKRNYSKYSNVHVGNIRDTGRGEGEGRKEGEKKSARFSNRLYTCKVAGPCVGTRGSSNQLQRLRITPNDVACRTVPNIRIGTSDQMSGNNRHQCRRLHPSRHAPRTL